MARTDFFAYSPNPQHPFRQLSMADDINPHEYNFAPTKFEEVTSPQRFPLHHAIVNITDGSIEGIIRTAHRINPASIHRQESHGFRPIFFAVKCWNLPAVRTLLTLGVQHAIFQRDNPDGMTPSKHAHMICRALEKVKRRYMRIGMDIQKRSYVSG